MHYIDEFDCLRFSSHMVPSVESVSSPLLFGWCSGSSPRIHPLSSFQCPPPESIGNICAEGTTRRGAAEEQHGREHANNKLAWKEQQNRPANTWKRCCEQQF